MADVKITELTENTSPAETDILPIVINPGSTPVTRKATLKTLLDKRLNYSIVPSSDFSLSAASGVQSAFPTTGDVFTLAAATTYEFEGQYRITKSGTTCTNALAFALGGGASITSMLYTVISQLASVNTAGTAQESAYVNKVASTVVTGTSTGDVIIRFSGIIRMNAGGTVTPQINFSAAPTTPVMKADSYIMFTPIGTNVENTKGIVA